MSSTRPPVVGSTVRAAVPILPVVAAAALGLFVGEDLQTLLFHPGHVVVAAVILATAAFLPKNRLRKVLAVLAALVMGVLSWRAGSIHGASVYRNCHAGASEVLAALTAAHRQGAPLPDGLDELSGSRACQTWTHGSLLNYEKTPAGFRLSYGDWLVSHTATQDSGFYVSK